jgi:hypothetical protein
MVTASKFADTEMEDTMKKRLLCGLLCLVMAAALGYAQSGGGDIEIGGTFLVYKQMEADFSLKGGGLNFAVVSYFGNVGGLGLYLNLAGGAAGGETLILLDGLIGPTFRIGGDSAFSLPIAIGLNLDYGYVIGSGQLRKGVNVGAGGNITARIKTGEKMHFYIRMQGAYGFLGGGELFITPSIGIGF